MTFVVAGGVFFSGLLIGLVWGLLFYVRTFEGEVSRMARSIDYLTSIVQDEIERCAPNSKPADPEKFESHKPMHIVETYL